MGIIKDFQELINDYNHDSALRSRLVLLGNKTAKVVKEHNDLKKELAEAKSKLARLMDQLGEDNADGELVEHQGVLFKRKASGGFHPVPFCPTCHKVMEKFEGFIKFNCLKCGITTKFTDKEIPDIINKIR